MQQNILLPASDGAGAASNRNVVLHLQQSRVFREYQQAFEATTGLPLALRPVGSFQSPLHASKRQNPFCALMAGKNRSCGACLELQQRVEDEACTEAKTLQCFAGLSESAVPIRVGDQVIGFLQTGQVFHREPTNAQFNKTVRQLEAWNSEGDGTALEKAYFETRVIPKTHYESVVRLLGIFAQHLSTLSNQLFVQEASVEAPAITKARQYIMEHQGEELSLTQVSHAVHMSAFYFCKMFKKATDLTFTDYLARVRVETVKKLLLNPHTRVSEAAYEAGFQSLSQFNRVFRRVGGESPSNYRDRLHGQAAG
jgi:AraC-like DNA-binding protein/ligand-binding sensor protein